MDKTTALRAVPLFAETLQPGDLAVLAGRARLVTYPAGAAIIRENDPEGSMYVIVEGSADVTVDDGAGSRLVATLSTGQPVGEMALLTGRPRLGTVTAREPVSAVEVTKAMMQSVLADSPRLYDRLAALLQKRQGDLDQILDPTFWADRSRESLVKLMRRHFDDPH